MKMSRFAVVLLLIIFAASLACAEPKSGKGKGAMEPKHAAGAGNASMVSAGNETQGTNPEAMPPGLFKKGGKPKGLSKKDKTPAGWSKGKKTGWQNFLDNIFNRGKNKKEDK